MGMLEVYRKEYNSLDTLDLKEKYINSFNQSLIDNDGLIDGDDISKKLKQVYELLGDECSKHVFVNRIDYLITMERKYIVHMLRPDFKEAWTKERQNFYTTILQRYPGVEIILYGAGEDGRRDAPFWKQVPEFSCFCDKNGGGEGQTLLGIDIISPDELFAAHKNAVIVISSSKHGEQIKSFLLEHLWNEEKIFSLEECKINDDPEQYFEKGVVCFDEHEIFVDGGTFDLSTSLELMHRCPGLKKVIAFEPDSTNYEKCLSQLEKFESIPVEVYKTGLWDKAAEFNFQMNSDSTSRIEDTGEYKIATVALDQIVDERITFLKLDIEGAELEALQGARRLIQKYRPKLAICIYHKEEDMVSIPLYISSLVPEYKFFVRHYSVVEAETILYAV